MKILDIGSGKLSEYGQPLQYENVIHADTDKNSYHLEIVCDIHNLPFKRDSFNLIHCSHVLEHVNHPVDAVKELKRVSKKYVVIKVPNAVYYKATPESKEHIYSWNEFTLANLVKKYFPYVQIASSHKLLLWEKNSNLRTIKRLLLSIILKSNELTATCRKK